MKYIKLIISVSDAYQEAMIAELLEMEFDAFEQQDGKLITYITKERFSDVNREQIERLLATYPGDGHIQSEEVVADQNWNKQWEQTIKAHRIGSFYVKPTWISGIPPEGTILLEIDPKMAFGTGYHETTRLMLKLLPEVIKSGDEVLDAGTGTGVLAIGAVKLGADSALAFDIDDWSIRNAKENILLNEVDECIQIRQGSVDVVPEGERFDVVLANINRNTIIDLLPDLIKVLQPNGQLVLSGLLISDKEIILRQEALKPFELVQSLRENDWIALQFKAQA